ncbi:MAG TPA: DUF1302 family protein, partial [Candidatus Bathyarchaeia archaeon]|nr:DUF1302 family protein [Candidatus Bathyarchaeia archaeon]
MRMKALLKSLWLPVCIAVLCSGAAHAFQFQASDSIKGSLDMQLTLGAGMRMVNQNPNLIGDPGVRPGANTAASSNGDDGDLNYDKHDLYTTYLKFTPELLLKFPADYKFMARGTHCRWSRRRDAGGRSLGRPVRGRRPDRCLGH